MLKINIKERPELEVKAFISMYDQYITVNIQPLPKKEDVDLEKKYRGGDTRITMGAGKKARQNSEIKIPDRDYYSLNLERAKKTWKKWDLLNEDGTALECNSTNIELVFTNLYDILVIPVLNKYDELMDKTLEEEIEQEEAELKN